MDKRYDYKEIEKELQEFWDKNKVYLFDDTTEKNCETRETFSIDTPPPNVSGGLHIGHVCSYSQTDFVARYKRLMGYSVFYPMGFDDNGLPTEKFVEKKHKIRAHNLKRSEFIKLCLEESKLSAEVFKRLFKSFGLSVDWSKTYSTISDSSRKISQNSFIELFNKNLVYRKKEPALYCTNCRTTVAQAELDDIEVATTFNDIIFKSESGKDLVVSTTRPELLPACVALFYNPEDKRYKDFNGQLATVPVFGNKVKILPDDSVDIEKGTGLVMCCTFGDQADVVWYKKHNLQFIQVVGRDGKWTEKSGPLAGLRVIEARKKVLELLDQAGLLKSKKDIKHSVNVHERCKKGIEYLVLDQWFVKILENRDKFIKLGDKINWNPSFMKLRYRDWVNNLGWDWCISRQRFYGVQFPVWYCLDCDEVLLANANDLPVDPTEQEYPDKICPKCSSSNISGESDVMDTWNTSSLTPQINIKNINIKNINIKNSKCLKLPMSLRAQAHDIIRTWTFYTIVKSFYHENTIPWENIAVSGYITAKGKEKISKSKGNAPTDPEKLLKTYSADSIRYWAANGRLGVDTLFSEGQFKVGQRLATKMWNAFRFCKEHIESYDLSCENNNNLDDLNKWLLHNLSDTVNLYIKHFDNYEHTFALEAVEKFFWHVFCDNYLELIKDRFFNPDKYEEKVIKNTQKVIYESCFAILQLFSPFVPHVTEKLYQLFYKEKEEKVSLHISLLDKNRFDCNFLDSSNIIENIIKAVSEVRKLKSENNLSLKVELESIDICSSDNKTLESI